MMWDRMERRPVMADNNALTPTTQVRVFSVPPKIRDIDSALRKGEITAEQHDRMCGQLVRSREGKFWDVAVTVVRQSDGVTLAHFHTTASAPTFGDL
jgi:hypothetical protein